MTNNYQDILNQIGYPTNILCLDFETYFDTEYSLKKMSTIEYINDPRFELTGLGVGNDIIELGATFIEPSDIECILVTEEREINRIVKEIEQNTNKYSNDDIKLLSSKVISAKQIDEDFWRLISRIIE